MISENTAKFAGGSALKLSLSEFREAAQKPPDTRTGEEVKQDMISKMKQFRREEGLK